MTDTSLPGRRIINARFESAVVVHAVRSCVGNFARYAAGVGRPEERPVEAAVHGAPGCFGSNRQLNGDVVECSWREPADSEDLLLWGIRRIGHGNAPGES